MTGSPDLRAWDAVVVGGEWRQAVEAETRLGDIQALERRIALKQRDGKIDQLILLVADTRHNRTVLRSVGGSLDGQFPSSGRRAVELLRAGVNPGASAVVLL